jgi:hypothetical protein
MKNIIVALFALLPCLLNASQFNIGPSHQHQSPNSLYLEILSGIVNLSDGDTINIDEGVYRGNNALAVWEQNNLLIRGIGHRPALYADGSYILGKGIFVSKGNNITYENLAFYDASVPDQNGAGIRLDGAGLTVRHCLFFNNENGILANDSEEGKVLIEYSEFAVGGFGDGFSHNIYINHCAELIIQFSYFHSASIGHQIKSRADRNIIRYNRIADLDGNSSRLIDLPNGGQSIILGNEIIQGENAENNNLIGFGLEGLHNPEPHNLKIISNTILNYRPSSCLFFDVNIDTDTFLITNNILGGSCTLFRDKEPSLLHNLILEEIEEVQFLDEDDMDYQIIATSPALDAGNLNQFTNLIPEFEYQHPVNRINRKIIGNIDLGAHESKINSHIEETILSLAIYPNPTDNVILIHGLNRYHFDIISLNGQVIKQGRIENNKIIVSDLLKGIYILRIENAKPFKFIKL